MLHTLDVTVETEDDSEDALLASRDFLPFCCGDVERCRVGIGTSSENDFPVSLETAESVTRSSFTFFMEYVGRDFSRQTTKTPLAQEVEEGTANFVHPASRGTGIAHDLMLRHRRALHRCARQEGASWHIVQHQAVLPMIQKGTNI